MKEDKFVCKICFNVPLSIIFKVKLHWIKKKKGCADFNAVTGSNFHFSRQFFFIDFVTLFHDFR